MLNALLDRRRLLLGLAAASTAAAAPVAVGATAPAENPELLRLADQLDAAIAEAAAARAHKQAVIDKWWWKWPTAPDAICYGYAKHHYTAEAETGLTGARILANGAPVPVFPSRTEAGPEWRAWLDDCRANPEAHYPRCVHSSDWLAAERDQALKAIERKRPRHPLSADDIAALRETANKAGELHAVAASYEAECARVKAVSGYVEAVARDKAAFDALAAVVGSIMRTSADSMTGVIIKAQALAAWQAEPMHMLHADSWNWPADFAVEVIRLASQSV